MVLDFTFFISIISLKKWYKSLTQARATIPALNAVQVQVLQQTLKLLERAFVNMRGQKHGFPR